mmetsp:Transcript_5723/g.35653  ORF Transcript_5723/g.35653 Transcript_5723/m.35653 type:complete len:92 (-) Transcript_5723:2234-2509(-)
MKLPLRMDGEKGGGTSLPHSKCMPKTEQSNVDIAGLLHGQNCRQAHVEESALLSTHRQAFMFKWEVVKIGSKTLSSKKSVKEDGGNTKRQP